MELAPRNAQYRLQLAAFLEELGETADAIQGYETTLRLDPDATRAPRIRERLTALKAKLQGR